MTRGYRLIDHTADLGVEIFGADERALFTEAAHTLTDLITDAAALAGGKRYALEISGDDWPDLMVNWLRELLYLWHGREQLVCGVDITAIEETRLIARVTGCTFRPERHEIRNDIKAVTYHQIEVGPVEQGWRARVIFDI